MVDTFCKRTHKYCDGAGEFIDANPSAVRNEALREKGYARSLATSSPLSKIEKTWDLLRSALRFVELLKKVGLDK